MLLVDVDSMIQNDPTWCLIQMMLPESVSEIDETEHLEMFE